MKVVAIPTAIKKVQFKGMKVVTIPTAIKVQCKGIKSCCNFNCIYNIQLKENAECHNLSKCAVFYMYIMKISAAFVVITVQ